MAIVKLSPGMYKEQQRQAALCKDYFLDGQSPGQIHGWKFIHWEIETRNLKQICSLWIKTSSSIKAGIKIITGIRKAVF